MFEGYWNRPADTLKIMRNMWLHSGDIGKFDENGYLYFVDRKKDYRRARWREYLELRGRDRPARAPGGGRCWPCMRCSPTPARTTLRRRSSSRTGHTLTEQALCRWAMERLPYFTIPRYFEFRKDLPRNSVGRVLKYQLRQEGCTPGTWDRERVGLKVPKR